MLNARLGVVATGGVILPRADKVTYDQARADLLAYYATHRERNVVEASRRLKHLDRYFTARRLVSIGPDDCTGYAAKRRTAGAANGTINRAALTRRPRRYAACCPNGPSRRDRPSTDQVGGLIGETLRGSS